MSIKYYSDLASGPAWDGRVVQLCLCTILGYDNDVMRPAIARNMMAINAQHGLIQAYSDDRLFESYEHPANSRGRGLPRQLGGIFRGLGGDGKVGEEPSSLTPF